MPKKTKLKLDPKNKKGAYQRLTVPLERSHEGTVRFVEDLRDVKKKLPAAVRRIWPDI